MWLDDCRIPFVDEGDKWVIDRDKEVIVSNPQHSGREDVKWKREGLDNSNTQGRFTPNLLVCDDMLNDGSVSNSTGGIPNGKSVYGRTSYNESSTINTQTKVGFGDKGTNSRYYDLDKWFDKVIDEIQ